MKQIIIVRKDLNMSVGKLSAQVGHASLAYFMYKIKEKAYKSLTEEFDCHRVMDGDKRQIYKHPKLEEWSQQAYEQGLSCFYTKDVPDTTSKYGYHIELVDKSEIKCEYKTTLTFDADIWENWINGTFTKVVCQVKNKNQLLKAIDIAEELGLSKNKDYFLIKDNCFTELQPEEFDENGISRTLN